MKACLLSKLLTLGASEEEEKEVFCTKGRVETQLAGRIQNQELGGGLCDPKQWTSVVPSLTVPKRKDRASELNGYVRPPLNHRILSLSKHSHAQI